MFILTHPVNFPVGGNRSARRKPTTFGRVLTDSFHMSGALSSSDIKNVLTENRIRGESWKHPEIRLYAVKQYYIEEIELQSEGYFMGTIQ